MIDGGKATAGANHVYYFEVGVGQWQGAFGFQITDWRSFWKDPIGVKYRLFTWAMLAVIRVFGKAPIHSQLLAYPDQGEAGVVSNDIRISKAGLTLYRLQERYILNPDGCHVRVASHERFGPFPFLFNDSKEYSARIIDNGMRAIYEIPLLGTQFTGDYRVAEDRAHIDAKLTCSWAEAQEVIAKVR